MARKSNKTAHVLNLIAGHDAAKDTADASNTTAADNTAASSESGHTPTSQTHVAPAAQNISVIDTTEEDPVADLIQQNLSQEFSAPEPEAEPVSASVPVYEPEFSSTAESIHKPDTLSGPEPSSEPVYVPEAAAPEPVYTDESTNASKVAPEVSSANASIPVSEPEPAAAPSSELNSGSEDISEPETAFTPETTPETTVASAPEPEPDFVRLNVMEGIVKDKIIYFMRQFDVCTCERCVNDTIALTMNGLLPKYIVTTPAAVDPLMSYYTNRLISDVTVEATKACIIVKDNPRH